VANTCVRRRRRYISTVPQRSLKTSYGDLRPWRALLPIIDERAPQQQERDHRGKLPPAEIDTLDNPRSRTRLVDN